MVVIGHRLRVDLADAALLRANRAREIAEVVRAQRDVRRHRLADRLAVVPGFGVRQQLQVVLNALRDL